MEEIVKTVDSIYGDMITAMSQIEVIIAAVTGGTDVNNGDVAGSLVVLKEYIEKRLIYWNQLQIVDMEIKEVSQRGNDSFGMCCWRCGC